MSTANRPLGPGATVGVVAPGFAVKRSEFRSGLKALQKMGFQTRVGESALSRQGYLAGSDEARADDLIAMMGQPDIDAIWFARGGYGAARLLDRLPWSRWRRRRPRPWIGYSDNTALLAVGRQRGVCRAFYGPVVTELHDSSSFHAGSLREALAGRRQDFAVEPRNVLCRGRASGTLVGGNLSVLTYLLGTPYQLRTKGHVLFLEDFGESCYHIDRMLTQWRQAGAFEGVRAVLFGTLKTTPRTHFPPDRKVKDVLRETFDPLGIPVCRGLPVGHLGKKRTLPFGATATVDTRARRVVITP
ncbi:MAG: LD-carboxypeptidase [Acidobacteriota bacterium]|nr:LD-carboxypeptidase [Acidobacteriota bacterium]MDH3784383.1 LD-carboxypeptidase [Acidobacteriota bacterium]